MCFCPSRQLVSFHFTTEKKTPAETLNLLQNKLQTDVTELQWVCKNHFIINYCLLENQFIVWPKTVSENMPDICFSSTVKSPKTHRSQKTQNYSHRLFHRSCACTTHREPHTHLTLQITIQLFSVLTLHLTFFFSSCTSNFQLSHTWAVSALQLQAETDAKVSQEVFSSKMRLCPVHYCVHLLSVESCCDSVIK